MKKRKTEIGIVSSVKQIIEVDSVEAANILLNGGAWILLNSYVNQKLGRKPVMRLGRIKDYQSISGLSEIPIK